jgi:hypothetical protein
VRRETRRGEEKERKKDEMHGYRKQEENKHEKKETRRRVNKPWTLSTLIDFISTNPIEGVS